MQISSKFTIGVHLLSAVNYLGEYEKVTSNVLAGSIGVNPVIVRNVMGNLKAAGIISISQGKTGITLSRKPCEITFYDIYKAVELVNEDNLFNFHENPNPACPIGSNIHMAMDSKLDKIQQSMENEMRSITLADVMQDITKKLESLRSS
ncbi:Rrf2 family protein [Staphylococcus pasteuri]|uniref:Rrf2 family transcriptional regulator n=1 Tax=Staphylococcus pasteuri_A TaxID=3062664 RepID=A0AAW7YSI4_9STAP|nr:Rrf2 family transcriptional regulator [Staphylococcus pasteuri_A]MDO6574732.1 Rrf2 family transcriptional regulator [Staphylococcus pasteuri_A]